MEKLNVAAHVSYIGVTGINYHFREFFRELSKYTNLKVRNFTVGSTWKGLTRRPHDNEPYINDVDKSILYKQSLWVDQAAGKRENFSIYNDYTGSFDVNIVADIVDHHFFYDTYVGPKIAYTVWESTKYPIGYFNLLKTYDEVWAASHWQKECLVKQGLDETKVSVVPAGVYSDTFFPEEVSFDKYYGDKRFKFVIFGRWSRRKGTREMIATFLKTFKQNEPVDLIISVDNPYAEDNLKTTEDRLKQNNLSDFRIKVVHYASRNEYIKFLKKGHVFLSCSRGEGWHLPLLESMACGIPSIYSNCSGQLEFATGKGHPVNIAKEIPDPIHPEWGDYCEPDLDHLSKVMRDVYTNYSVHKQKAMVDSMELREKFNWEAVGKIGFEKLSNFHARFYKKINVNKPRLKILFITPHLSTGGMPQYLLKKIQVLSDSCDVYCVEYNQIATFYVVQRNAISGLLKDRFYTLQDKPKEQLLEIIENIKPDVIHFEDFPEMFVNKDIAIKIYKKDRNYLIFEGYHGLQFKPENKIFFPDKFTFISEYQSEIYKKLEVPYIIVEYPIEIQSPAKEVYKKELGFEDDYKHVINVGLFTPGKNQSELLDYARNLLDQKIKFHFIGNMAENFQAYWKPLLDRLPNNCVTWGERADVEKFYQAADLMVFTSKIETSPIVIREAISWQLPTLIHKLPAYKNMYDQYGIKYLHPSDYNENIEAIKNELHLK